MKYIQFTYVDYATKLPVTQEPAKRGPCIPEGITPSFAVESSYGPTPIFYGTAEDDYKPEDWMVEVEEKSFYSALNQELKDRARVKRKAIEQGGLVIGDNHILTSVGDQNRVSNMVSGLNVTPWTEEVDFEYSPGQWTVISREEATMIGQAVFNHVQLSFSWCKSVHDKIDAITSLEDASPIVQEISQASLLTLYPELEEDVSEEGVSEEDSAPEEQEPEDEESKEPED